MSSGGLGGEKPPSAKAVSLPPAQAPSQSPPEGLSQSPSESPSESRTVGLVSLGCPKNLVDGEVMLGRLQGAGYRLVADAKQADVVVVNTCAFIDRAKQESVDTILEMAREKDAGRAQRLVVTGCLTQRYDAELRKEIPEIDATLGTGQVDDIVRAVAGEATSLDEAEPGLPTWVYDHTAPRVLSTPPWLAYVKISEGCDYTCSFCIIPTLRGRHRSRGVEDIVAEARGLAARGVREIVLVAQDSTRYGLDHGVRDGLAYLLRRLGRVDGIRWIRVMYAYPSTLTDPILDAIASEEKVVKYVDIPLQHASAAGLEAHEAADRPRATSWAWSSGSASGCRGSPSGRPSSSASPGRPGRTSSASSSSSRPVSSTTWASSRSPTRRGRAPSTCPGASPPG